MEELDAIDDVEDCSVSIFDSSSDSTLEYDGISEYDDSLVNFDASKISLNVGVCEYVVEIIIFVKAIVDSDDNEDKCSKAKLDTRSEVIVVSTDDRSAPVGFKVGVATFDKIAADELSEMISTSVWFCKKVVVAVLKADSADMKVNWPVVVSNVKSVICEAE